LENIGTKEYLLQSYSSFIPSEKGNFLGSEWQFDENIILEDDVEGTIVLDVLLNGKVGGIEF
jgi:uncharacterized protein YuzE